MADQVAEMATFMRRRLTSRENPSIADVVTEVNQLWPNVTQAQLDAAGRAAAAQIAADAVVLADMAALWSACGAPRGTRR
jgi:hypothetical protein